MVKRIKKTVKFGVDMRNAKKIYYAENARLAKSSKKKG